MAKKADYGKKRHQSPFLQLYFTNRSLVETGVNIYNYSEIRRQINKTYSPGQKYDRKVREYASCRGRGLGVT